MRSLDRDEFPGIALARAAVVLGIVLAMFSVGGSPGAHAATSAGVPRPLWDETIAQHSGEGPALWTALPRDGAVIAGEAARFSGCTEPGCRVTVNGKDVTVYPTGAFAGVVPLRPGANRVTICAARDGRKTLREFAVRRPETPRELSARPLAVGSRFAIQPSLPLELLPSDEMIVRCQSVPGAKGFFLIDGRSTPYPLRELPAGPGKAPFRGMYEGSYSVRRGDSFDHAQVRIVLQALDGARRRTLTVIPAGTLTTGRKHVVRFVEAARPDTGLYTDLSRNDRLLSVAAGTRLEVTGRRGDLLRVKLSRRDTAWAPSERTSALPGRVRKIPVRRLESATLVEEPARNSAQLSLLLRGVRRGSSAPLPVRIAGEGDKALRLTIYGLSAEPFQMAAPQTGRSSWLPRLKQDVEQSQVIEDLRWDRAGEESLSLFLALSKPVWGYDAEFGDDAVNFRVRARPLFVRDDPKGPLSGVAVVLDPGHGGADPGALGSSGMRESDANLAVAWRVAERLRAVGASVVMTRTGDEYVDLDARAERIARSDADVFLSIHCNSVSEDADPLEARGARAFFYCSPGENLAGAVLRSVEESLKSVRAGAGPEWQNLRLVRACSQMPGALLECLYLSNPEEEMLLLNPAFLDTLGDGIYKGMFAFLQGDVIHEQVPTRLASGKSFSHPVLAAW